MTDAMRSVLTELQDEIASMTEREVTFSNGCWLSLVEDGGMYWGTTPYGTDWGCEAGPRLKDSVGNWLAYWNAPRSESGSHL